MRQPTLTPRIQAAFEHATMPRSSSLCKWGNTEGIDEFFHGRTWQALTSPTLSRYTHALGTFFTDEAFHYYLPAFMIAAVEWPDAGNMEDVIAQSLTPPKLDVRRPSFASRWALFDRAQREVTIDVLAHIDARERGVNRLGDAVACLRQTLDA